jgi:hypothetical protein
MATLAEGALPFAGPALASPGGMSRLAVVLWFTVLIPLPAGAAASQAAKASRQQVRRAVSHALATGGVALLPGDALLITEAKGDAVHAVHAPRATVHRYFARAGNQLGRETARLTETALGKVQGVYRLGKVQLKVRVEVRTGEGGIRRFSDPAQRLDFAYDSKSGTLYKQANAGAHQTLGAEPGLSNAEVVYRVLETKDADWDYHPGVVPVPW